MSIKMIRAAVIAAMLFPALRALPSQGAPEVQGRRQATRVELEERVRGLEELARSTPAADPRHVTWSDQLSAIRTRLTEGDFRPGDRIVVAVAPDPTERVAPEGTARTMEQQLSDTFVVGEAREMALPLIGPFVLRGVLRSELEGRLTQEVGRFIKSPVVSARPLVRLSVQGGVVAPGFYSLPADAVISDAVMAAGGPAAGSRIGKLRIERNGERVWEGDALQRALAEGRTLDDMSLRGGDQFVVPERARTSDMIRTLGIALTIPVTVFTVIRLF